MDVLSLATDLPCFQEELGVIPERMVVPGSVTCEQRGASMNEL